MDKFNDVNQSERNSANFQEIENEPLPTQNYNTETQGIPRYNNAVEFRDFITNFQLESFNKELERRYPHHEFSKITQEDIINSTIYKPIPNNPMRNKSLALLEGLRAFNNNDFVTAVLYLDETIINGQRGLDLLSVFSTSLIRINQFDRAVWAIKQVLRLKPEDLKRHILLCKIYIKYKCKYQACQTAFNWLKNNELYSHLIPLDFTMVNKNSSELDNNEFNSVEEIFFQALQLHSGSPDSDLENMLRLLYYGSGDFLKVIYCLFTKIISSDTILPVQIRTVGYCNFLLELPNEALEIFHTLIETAKRDAYVGIGFVHMYLKNYSSAILYFKQVISPRILVENFQIQGNTLKDEFDLCLRLYCECLK